MKKSKEFDEFIKWLEEAVKEMADDNGIPDRPIFIDISINLCPAMGGIPAELCIPKESKMPVDILETDKNIHALLRLEGVKRENIKLSCTGKTLEIATGNQGETQIETIELPARVNKKGMKTTYNNGILEVIFNKSKKRVKSKDNPDDNK